MQRSLIDEVKKYRDYTAVDNKGVYAQMFEEEYTAQLNEILDLDETPYIVYLKNINVAQTHNGYFSIDKKSKQAVDSETKGKTGEADDVDAYDLILKDKERLLSFTEPVRFIFSHSALREGWDNPNVFVICALKHATDNTTTRRQEVGRGLRLCVNQQGERMDKPHEVHDINVLTVVASESYKDFVTELQKDMAKGLSARPHAANEAYFEGKNIRNAQGELQAVSAQQAKQIYRYLVKNDYTDDTDGISAAYVEAKNAGALAELPAELQAIAPQIFALIDSVYSDSAAYEVVDDRKPKSNPLNDNFYKKEFQALWTRIHHKAAYRVAFDGEELAVKCAQALDSLRVTRLQATVQVGVQLATHEAAQLHEGSAFGAAKSHTESISHSAHSSVHYDLIGDVVRGTELTRAMVARMLGGLNAAVFAQFKTNPEHFISEVIRIINEQKATMVIDCLTYDTLNDTYNSAIFTADKTRQNFALAGQKLNKHVFDYVLTDSKIERQFVSELDGAQEVAVYAKLPKGFLIPTPVGDYNPDWAIAFTNEGVKHIYFVAETKGSMSSMELRGTEDAKIKCAQKFFERLNRDAVQAQQVKYNVVAGDMAFAQLMQLVG